MNRRQRARGSGQRRVETNLIELDEKLRAAPMRQRARHPSQT